MEWLLRARHVVALSLAAALQGGPRWNRAERDNFDVTIHVFPPAPDFITQNCGVQL